jgi:hypothetical protein
MPILKRELAFGPAYPSKHIREWWHLILDTDTPGLWVEYTWQHQITHSDMDVTQGIERFGINDFLSLAEGKAAHPMLLTALKEMFRNVDPHGES